MYLQKFDLGGRRAVVTGGAQGIGAACADALGALTLSSPRVGWPLQRATAERWVGRLPADQGGN